MNCKQVENLLPLYVSQDLDEGTACLIAAHVQSCAACGSAAAEYGEARDLMNSLAAPVVADEVYAQMRQNVWLRIEAESNRPSLFDSMKGWFQPRFVWIPVAAMCLLIFVVGLYSLNRRSSARRDEVANNPQIDVQPRIGSSRRPVSESPGSGPMEPPRRRNLPKPQRRHDPLRVSDRAMTAVASSLVTQPTKIESSPNTGTNELAGPTRDPEKTLRMEIQTSNPNIRIIWFSQQDRKPAAVHSKGI